MKKKTYQVNGGISSSDNYRWMTKKKTVKQVGSKPGIYRIEVKDVVRNGSGKIPKRKDISQEAKDNTAIMIKYQAAEKRKESVKSTAKKGFNIVKNTVTTGIKNATVSDKAKRNKMLVSDTLYKAYDKIKNRR